MTLAERVLALAELARAWQDPEHEDREVGIEAILEGEERFTEEGLAFALNHRMHQLSEIAPGDIAAESVPEPRTVGITPARLDPLGGLAEAVAALALGHRVMLEAPSPLVAAFLDRWGDRTDGDVQAAPRDALIEDSDAWIVRYGTDEASDIEHELESVSFSDSSVEAVRIREGVVILDGREDQEVLSGLAEDLMLHEGLAPGTPRIVWAPAGMSPDLLLNALAGFRELYPAHPDTAGTLALPTAFLAAAKQSHATGPGFLVSLGDPEAQAPGHIRWVEYAHLDEVEQWVQNQETVLQSVVATPAVSDRLGVPVPVVRPGDVHRTTLFSPGLLPFLQSL